MEEYNVARFVDNIYAIAKQQKIPIGSIEKQARLSTGYLSRLKKNESNISLKNAYNISRILKSTLDCLITVNFTEKFKQEELKKEKEQIVERLKNIEKEIKYSNVRN